MVASMEAPAQPRGVTSYDAVTLAGRPRGRRRTKGHSGAKSRSPTNPLERRVNCGRRRQNRLNAGFRRPAYHKIRRKHEGRSSKRTVVALSSGLLEA